MQGPKSDAGVVQNPPWHEHHRIWRHLRVEGRTRFNKKGSTTWSPFAETSNYFEPSTKDFMINYRVSDLEALVEELKKEGVTIVDKIETYDYGKFVHIMDPEGNKLELWEPAD